MRLWFVIFPNAKCSIQPRQNLRGNLLPEVTPKAGGIHVVLFHPFCDARAARPTAGIDLVTTKEKILVGENGRDLRKELGEKR